MNSLTQGSTLFESYLKVKNIQNEENKEKVSIGFFILNIKEKSLIYKKNKESSSVLAKHGEQDILNFIQTVDTNDKGICDYPIGFQIITTQRVYILYANSRIIYTRWLDNLKTFFKESNKDVNITPDRTPEKGKSTYLNSNFKEKEKSPIVTKNKLTNKNDKSNNQNDLSNNLNGSDKVLGFDDDLMKALNDFDDNETSKKISFKVNFSNNLVTSSNRSNNLINNNNFSQEMNKQNKTPFEKSLDNDDNLNMVNKLFDDDLKNEVFTLKNKNGAAILKGLNNGWDKDLKEITYLIKDKNRDLPTYNKSQELKNLMSKNISKPESNSLKSAFEISDYPKDEKKYRSNILLIDDPSLHIRQSVNEIYTVENLHFGIEDNNKLNKSIDCKNELLSQKKNSINTCYINKISKADINDNKIDSINNNYKIRDTGEGTWTFSITVPI